MADNFSRKRIVIVATTAILIFASVKGLSAWNARVTPEKIAAGQALFEHEWSVNDSLCGKGDGLGPVFNANSCVACHFKGGVGGSSGNRLNVVSFETISDEPDFVPETGVVHKQAIEPGFLETQEHVRELHPTMINTRLVTEAGPMVGSDCGYNPITREVEETIDPLVIHELNSPALFGVGLIDGISNLSVSFHGHKRMAQKIGDEMSGDFEGNRLGMINMVDGQVGKFGWKGQFASLEDFVASACAMEIGLTNSMHAQPIAKEYRADEAAKMDMTRRQLNELVCFVRSLPRPEQVLPTDASELEQVGRGENAFTSAGCADCHVQDFGGIEGIYSDFHLYNLEPVVPNPRATGYSDGKAEEEFDFDRSHPHPDQWQTPALWGVADSAPYMHDGSAYTMADAIKAHQGQAKSSLDRFNSMTKADRDSLIKFLGTLKAPVVRDNGLVASVQD